MRLAGLGKCIWSWSEASGARFPFEISVRNTSEAEAAPKCAFQALKLDLGLPGTKAFAARISGLGTAWSSRFVETRAKRVLGGLENAFGVGRRLGELDFASVNGARNTIKAEAAAKCTFQALDNAFWGPWKPT